MVDPKPYEIDRRTFCKQTATAAVVAATSQAVSGESAEVEETIDCHPHFYDPRRPEGVPWPNKKSALYRTVLPKHLKALPKPRALTGTVVVEASKWVEDNQWLLDLAKDAPFIVGIVGNLTPGADGFQKHLTRFAKNKLFRGIRVLRDEIIEPNLSDKTWRADIKQFIDHDLSLDVNGGPETASAVAQLAKSFPDLRIVINHISNVSIDGREPPREWAEGMRSAGRHKNVYCKVSALVEGAGRNGRKAPKELSYYKPTLDVVWDAFGDDRLIYGSNWPVSERAADYATLQNIVIEYVSARGAEATQKYFSLNSKQAYKWIDRKGRLQAALKTG